MSRLYTIHYMPQHLADGTTNPEWLQARVGRFTASTASDMLAEGRKKGEESTSRRNLRVKLVLERLTQKAHERTPFKSFAMKQGTATEAEAQGAYEVRTGTLMENTGFCAHNVLPIGCSLDGAILNDDDEVVEFQEIKCPLSATHLTYLRTGIVPAEYMAQVTHQFWVLGPKATHCDWVSYDPSFPEHLRLKIVRIARDEALVSAYATLAEKFLLEVDRELIEVSNLEA